MFGDIIQPTHLLFILLVALIVLGPKRLPEVGRSLGKGLRDFRSAMSGIEEHASGLLHDDPPPASPPAPPVVPQPAATVPQPAVVVPQPAVVESQPVAMEQQPAAVEPQPAAAVTVSAVAPQPMAPGVPDPEPGDYAD